MRVISRIDPKELEKNEILPVAKERNRFSGRNVYVQTADSRKETRFLRQP
jgi:hypothetical protein